MLRIMAILAVSSALIYILLAIKGWAKQAARWKVRTRGAQPAHGARAEPATPDIPRRAYFWGLAFAVLFYYGFLIWWGRYGIGRAVKLSLACFAAVGLIQFALRYAGMIDIEGLGESIAVGLLISVPIRAVGGIYVANHDGDWRSAILTQRRMRRQAGNGDA